MDPFGDTVVFFESNAGFFAIVGDFLSLLKIDVCLDFNGLTGELRLITVGLALVLLGWMDDLAGESTFAAFFASPLSSSAI